MKPAIIAATLLAGAAPPAAQIDRTPLLDQALPSSVTVRHVEGRRVGFAPGAPAGRHVHPVPVVGVVTKGSFLFQIHGEPMRTLATGDAFYEPAGAVIERFDNASTTAPAEIDVFYLLTTPGQSVLVTLPR